MAVTRLGISRLGSLLVTWSFKMEIWSCGVYLRSFVYLHQGEERNMILLEFIQEDRYDFHIAQELQESK